MKIGLLGMGTVGGGVRELAARLPDVKIARILERVHTRPEMTNHIEDILRDDSISLIVETMGGLHPAYEFAVQSLESGRHFVTANKLLVSAYGRELQALARRRGVGFLFGAACVIYFVINFTLSWMRCRRAAWIMPPRCGRHRRWAMPSKILPAMWRAWIPCAS